MKLDHFHLKGRGGFVLRPSLLSFKLQGTFNFDGSYSPNHLCYIYNWYLILKPWYSVPWSQKNKRPGHQTKPPCPLFQKHCFFKNCPKNLTNFEKFKIFLHFLLQFYRALQWYIVCFHTLSGLGCTDQNVNQEIGGYVAFLSRLYMKL